MWDKDTITLYTKLLGYKKLPQIDRNKISSTKFDEG